MSSLLDPFLATLRDAAARRQPLSLRGGASKAFLAPTPAPAVLDTRPLAGIVAYEPTELVVTAWAGTSLATLEAELAAQGQCLPFEPPRFGAAGAATLGGMVASGLSGPARASVGATRDYVLGAQIVNGRAEVMTFGGQVMKNVAGYDVSRLMAGSWGALGLIAQVSLKVLPVAPAEATLRFSLAQGAALDWLQRWGGQPLPLNASRWQDGVLWLRLRGAVAAVEAACERLLGDVAGERLDTATAAADWTACRDQTLPFFTAPDAHLALWRLSVAPHAAALELPGPQLIEWHGGQRWVWAPAVAGPQLIAAAAQAGGHATLWRLPGDGSGADVPRHTPRPAALARIEARLKAEFDPHGIFI